MRSHTVIAGRWLRFVCAASTYVSSGVNLLLLFAHRPLLSWLGVPLPMDVHLFFVETSLSFTLGLVGLLAMNQKPQSGQVAALLGLGALGKGLYAAATFASCALGREHPFFYTLAAGDAFLVLVFLLTWVQASGEALFELQVDVFEGLGAKGRAATKRALLLGMADKTSTGLERVAAALTRQGYEVDVVPIVPQVRQSTFARVAGALTRAPAPAAPLALPTGHDWDLVVVESPDWLFGLAAPVETVLRDPANREVFQGRDAVALVVSRGSHRRTLAMMVALLERAGANVVAARALVDQEARGLLPRVAGAPTYALSPASRTEAESLGTSLARRSRTKPHWTLLLRGPSGEEESDA
jgi:hypothetical protein